MDMSEILKQEKPELKTITIKLPDTSITYIDTTSKELGIPKQKLAFQLIDFAINEMKRTQKEISLLNKKENKK